LVEDLDYTQKIKVNIFDLVDVFNKEMNNILFRHFKERDILHKRKYPYKIIKINL
jgi:hypothetical protein